MIDELELCDKCHKPVDPTNDIVRWAIACAGGDPKEKDAATMLFYGARHLLPTGGCEGSPSRAQYLEGQPRDERKNPRTLKLLYPYDPEFEQKAREGFDRLVRAYL